MAKENVILVDELSRSYGDVTAVAGLSFSVGRGEIFGILGPNGSGKTTTIECVLGTRARDAGTVKLFGVDPAVRRPALFQRIGVQFQESAWQPTIKVHEICEVTAAFYNRAPDWQALLAEFDLEKRKASQVESLSGGERQKLSILLACMHEPELVVLDELTTGLDPVARRQTWGFVRRLREKGMTILLASHFMDEVEALCDRALILREGRKIVEGSISEIRLRGKGTSLEDSYIALVGGAE